MASKNTNIVSKTLVESYIRKQVKALKQSPAETIDTLTKQLLDKPKGSLEKYLLHITPEKLQDTQSGYYKLFHDILPKVNTDHLVTLGIENVKFFCNIFSKKFLTLFTCYSLFIMT